MLANKIIKRQSKTRNNSDKEYIKIYINWHIYIREVIKNNYGEQECINTFYPDYEINNLTSARKALKWAASFKDDNKYKIEFCLEVYATGSNDNFNYSRDFGYVSDLNEEITLEKAVIQFPNLKNRLTKEHKNLIKLANKLEIFQIENLTY